MRSDQLLRAMHKVFSHDLPNQMVVLQSLLQLLDQDEAARLSGDGREYLRRLLNATRRASDMVRFLKEMGRLNSFTPRSETIALDALARELQGELHRLYPGRTFEFDGQWRVPALVGDARVFLSALLELFAGLLAPQGKWCHVAAGSERAGDGVALTFRLDEKSGAPRPVGFLQMIEQRMEIVLAGEWLRLCDAHLELTLPADGATRFTIAVPGS
ncbi:MAG: hypothetical protein HY289_00360 [Planctomycetes bacterium]|nr:hypothetical protein [Planctomycetota bacterium]